MFQALKFQATAAPKGLRSPLAVQETTPWTVVACHPLKVRQLVFRPPPESEDVLHLILLYWGGGIKYVFMHPGALVTHLGVESKLSSACVLVFECAVNSMEYK